MNAKFNKDKAKAFKSVIEEEQCAFCAIIPSSLKHKLAKYLADKRMSQKNWLINVIGEL